MNYNIYCIKPKGEYEKEYCYYGSTNKQDLNIRLLEHLAAYYNFIQNKTKSCSYSYKIFEKYGVNNCEIILVESIVADKDEVLEREKYWIMNNDCINKAYSLGIKATRKHDQKKYNEEYYNLWKATDKYEQFKTQRKEYYQNNKDKIIEASSLIIECNCGCRIQKRCYAKHIRTTKHIELMNNLGV